MKNFAKNQIPFYIFLQIPVDRYSVFSLKFIITKEYYFKTDFLKQSFRTNQTLYVLFQVPLLQNAMLIPTCDL